MSTSLKVAIGVILVVPLLHWLIKLLEPTPPCYTDEQCADLHEQEMER